MTDDDESQRLLSEHARKITASAIFHTKRAECNVLIYLVENESVLPTLDSRRREGWIARDVFKLELDGEEHLHNDNARVRNAVNSLRGLLEEYNDAHPDESIKMTIPARRDLHFTIRCVIIQPPAGPSEAPPKPVLTSKPGMTENAENARHDPFPPSSGHSIVSKRVLIFLMLLMGGAAGLIGYLLGPGQIRTGAAGAKPTKVKMQISGRSEILPTVSPAADRIVYSWDGAAEGDYDLYVSTIDKTQKIRLTSSPAQEISPVWSPDNRMIAFVSLSASNSFIGLISALGGPVQRVIDIHQYRSEIPGRQLDWSPDGRFLAVSDWDSTRKNFAVFFVSLDDRHRLTKITSPPQGAIGDSDPAFSPDGHTLAFLRTGSGINLRTPFLISVDTSGPDIQHGFERSLDVDAPANIPGLTWSADGRYLIMSLPRYGSRLMQVDPVGAVPSLLTGVSGEGSYPSIRGSVLAYNRAKVDTDVFRVRLSPSQVPESHVTPLIASEPWQDAAPQISPDGTRIAYVSDQSGVFQVFVCDKDNRDRRILTSIGAPGAGSPRWSPDGMSIVFDSRQGGQSQIYTVTAEGSRPPNKITSGNTENSVPSWSHDGKHIYFSCYRSNAMQICSISPDGTGLRQVTHGGGFAPFESVDGRYIYYAKARRYAGLWRCKPDGTDEREVLRQLRPNYWSMWALTSKGIYFLDADETFGPFLNLFMPVVPSVLKFASFRDFNVRTLGEIKLEGSEYASLAAAPDDSYVLIGAAKHRQADVIVNDRIADSRTKSAILFRR